MFKVGDKVRCINTDGANMLTVGKVYIVCKDQFRQWVEVINDVNHQDAYIAGRFELVTDKESTLQTEKQPHKHRDLIIAWADGAAIECRNDEVNWFETKNPSWCLSMEYRVKPDIKPDQSRTMFVELNPRLDNAYNKPNLKLTFDGETGNLKATEIIDND